MLERILYYKGQAMFFYMPSNEEFYFLPYALDGSIDVYGRFKGVTPLPFGNGKTATDEKGKEKPWITGLTRKPKYEVVTNLTMDDIENGCVLLSDYSKQYGQINIARQILQEPLLDTMSECIPFMRTALLNSTGVNGMRVNDEDSQANVKAASRSINRAALEGEKWIPVVGNIEFQDLTSGEVAKSEEFLIAMQALDNFRLSLYGLENGGLFQKKTYLSDSQDQMNNGNVGVVYQDGLTLRQRFCDIVNSIWGLGIWCESSETVSMVDKNLDGELSDDQDQSGTMEGEQPEVNVNE